MIPRWSFRFGLYLAFLLLVSVPALLGFLFFERILIQIVRDEYLTRADSVGRGVLAELTRREEDLGALAVKYAADPELIAAWRAGRRDRIEARLRQFFLYSTLDLLEAGDAAGRVLARGHRPGDFGEDKRGQQIIQAALAGQPAADIESGVSGLALRAVAPVSAGGGIVGTVMTGTRLNRDFLKSYRLIAGYEFALYEGTTLISSTAEPPAWSPAEVGAPQSVTLAQGSHELWGVYLPVRHSTGRPFGGLLLWQDSAVVLPSLRANQVSLGLILGSGLVLALLFAFFLSRNLSAPLKQMLGAMDTVSRGTMRVELPESPWQEFRELAAHFTAMLAELKRSREEIERTQQQLLTATKLAVLGRVTAELAHEIRNPLNSMGITLRVLKDRLAAAAAPAEVTGKIELVLAEIKRLNHTLSDFIQAGGEIVLRPVPLDLAAETRAVLSLLHSQIESLGIELSLDLPAGPAVPVDRDRFHQAIRNLVLNACQSMSAGGRVTVRGRSEPGRYALAISDTGSGLTRAEQEQLLDFPFTTKTAGLGCGLAYVMRIIQAHHGEFGLSSEPGQGTTVTISFPARTTERAR